MNKLFTLLLLATVVGQCLSGKSGAKKPCLKMKTKAVLCGLYESQGQQKQAPCNNNSSAVLDAIKNLKAEAEERNNVLKEKLEDLKYDIVKEVVEAIQKLIPTVPPTTPPPKVFKTCQEIYNDDPAKANSNRAYELELDSGKVPVYCHMSAIEGCGSGGFTLVMKIDGSKNTFRYDSALWADKNVYNSEGGKTGLDNQETKLPTYWTTPFTKICLGMKAEGQTKFISVDLNSKASSLHSLIADGTYRATSLGRDEWKSLVPGASLQSNCNREGFNAMAKSGSSKARIGITSNNENDCSSNDSRIGFGTGGYPDENNACGDTAKHGGDNGDKAIKALGYIFVQ